MVLKIKRVYDKPENDDGLRILVDRLWPRGASKDKAKIDLWLKDIAPTNELRKCFSHDPKKWEQFQRRYKEEFKQNKEGISRLRQAIKGQQIITLLYSAKDTEHNNAIALKKFLSQK